MQFSSPDIAKISHFEDQFGEPHGMFACQASVPLIFSTDLLYKIWLNFNTYTFNGQTKKIPHWAVSDLILSGFCQPVGYKLYKLDADIRNYLLHLLVERLGTDRQIQLAGLLQQFAEKYYAGAERNIQEIHLLTAASILDPADMERQVSNQLKEKLSGNKVELINLLTLYFNLSGEKIQDAGGENFINLVAEDDPSAPGYLQVVLPEFIQDRVQPNPVKLATGTEIFRESMSEAVLIVTECLDTKNATLDLGNCGLSDAHFEKGSLLDKSLRQCFHLQSLTLSNEWYVRPYVESGLLLQKSNNVGKENNLSIIPAVITELTNLSEFNCGGEPGNQWGISEIPLLSKLKNLKWLNLKNNNIVSLNGIQDLVSLKHLDISSNQIRDVNELNKLTALQFLDLNNNLVTDVRPLLSLIKKDSPIQIVVKEFKESVNDNELNVYGNPLAIPPIEIIKQGNKVVINYFDELHIEERRPIIVSVRNGDLFYSSYPIMVGHFINDGITSAEKVIDTYSGNILSERHRLNLYPGNIGSSEIFLNVSDEFKGSVVIGLGESGRLSSYQLSQSVELGIMKYVMTLSKLDNRNVAQQETGISVLLIGSAYGGLSMESSIWAILQGIQNANNKIKELNSQELELIDRVEFVELFEDRGLQCQYILNRIENDEDADILIRIPQKEIKKSLGSRTRIPMENENDWWSRIKIEMQKRKSDGDNQEVRFLHFSANIQRARIEDSNISTSPEIIDSLLEELSIGTSWNIGLAKNIFELLMPNELKHEIKRPTNIIWVLDTESAAYPWELLQDTSANARPLCCNAGMIRQLKLEDYRLNVNGVGGKKAFVVGDPDLNGYLYAQQLPGAFKEANMVASVLNEHGYEMPFNCLNKSSTEIISALFKDEYKIIHLAGHGIFNDKDPNSLGMLIGNGVFLSSKEISQMSKVPELVFVNCCFLGKIGEKDEALVSNRYKLAANFGTQLIMNGVKVVIAAGWAVDDAAAFYFTGIFYNAILGGNNFGDAIKEARLKTFSRYPHNNTWGAYQCYGDPFFKLTEYKKTSSYTSINYAHSYLSAQEAENDLGNLINRSNAKGTTIKSHLNHVAAISKAVDVAGIRNATITEKEAIAYAECNDFENAILRFESLFSMENANPSLKVIEKYCDIRAKLCINNWQLGIEKNKQMAKMERVISDSKQLLNMSPTAERLNLVGSVYKRKSMISTTNADKVKALVNSAEYYKRSYDTPHYSNRNYSLINWLEIERILFLIKAKPGISSIIKKYKFAPGQKTKNYIADAIRKMISSDTEMDFRNEITLANALLCAWLIDGKNTNEFTDKMVIASFKKAWGIAGSLNKKILEIEHFDFLISTYTSLVNKPTIVSTIKKIKQDVVNITNEE